MFEAGMIICFGISWPVAIVKTLRTRCVRGKSKMFLTLVLSGYALGIAHKIFYSLDYVLLLYLFNFSMVLIEMCLYFRYQQVPVSETGSGAGAEGYEPAHCGFAELPAGTLERKVNAAVFLRQ